MAGVAACGRDDAERDCPEVVEKAWKEGDEEDAEEADGCC